VLQLNYLRTCLWALLPFAVLSLAASFVAAQEMHPAQELIDRASAAVRTDPEASRRDAEAALEELVRAPDVDLELRARLILCDYLSERDRGAAEEQIARASELLPRAQRAGLRAGLLDCRGTIMETAGDNASARQLFDEAVGVATAENDDEMLANALYSRGYLLGLQGRYAAGLSDLKRAQGIFESLDLPHHALTALNGIAIMYNRMGDYAQARDMYSRAIKAQRAAGLRRELGVTLHNLGRAHENLREWPQARAAFKESAEISRSLRYGRGEAYALRGLAAVASGENDPATALEILDRAEALQRETPDARLHAQIQLARGIAYHKLRRLPDSIAMLEKALEVFVLADSSHELRETYATMAAVYAEMGNWRAAYEHLAQAKQASERLLQNQLDQRFATLKVEFDTAAKDKENALLLRENEANQKALEHAQRARTLQRAVIALTAVLALMLASLAVHQWRTTRRMRRLAMTDELTGVPNRRAVLRRLAPLLLDSRTRCVLLIIDIDHFKQINDRYGHPEGDEALKLVAACLRREVAAPSFLGRLGGEEFVIVLPDVELAAGRALAEHIRQEVMKIDTRRWLAERQLTVSIGATLSVANDTMSSLLQRADAALYEAKRAGRNCVIVRLAQDRNAEVASPEE
jgi:diguanylate cyclase (GGDEF)-like protein